MPKILSFSTFADTRGTLTVMDQDMPFEPKRCFLVYDFKCERGGHGHVSTKTVLFAASGVLEVEVRIKGLLNQESKFYVLDKPCFGLYLDPEDWHTFKALADNTVLLCIASHSYSKDDYFYERP
jgi:hypothetical protein